MGNYLPQFIFSDTNNDINNDTNNDTNNDIESKIKEYPELNGWFNDELGSIYWTKK